MIYRPSVWHWLIASLFFTLSFSMLTTRISPPLATPDAEVAALATAATTGVSEQGGSVAQTGVERVEVSAASERVALWYFFIVGLIAICAMLLPGVSGSFTLLILGVYATILSTFKSFFAHLFTGTFLVYEGWTILILLAGVGVGFLLFSRVMSLLFKELPSFTSAAIIGIMGGCLRVIWPFREADTNVLPVWHSPLTWTVFATIAGGIILVVTLQWIDIKRNGWELPTTDG